MQPDDDPRLFPDAAAAPAEAAGLHALAAASQAAMGQEAARLDGQIQEALAAMLSPGSGARLAAVFDTAPSSAVYRHLWRLLVPCEHGRSDGPLGITVFALPLIVVAGIDGGGQSRVAIDGVLNDPASLCAILREHGALAGNQSFGLANTLVAAGAIDVEQLPDVLAWRELPDVPASARVLDPAPIMLSTGPETVHLRFIVGSAIAAPDAKLLEDSSVGKWGIPFTQALGRQLAVPGASMLALPRAPQSLLNALWQGRVAHRDVGAHIFASNAIRKLRASVGEPTAVMSCHRCVDVPGGGEVRLSLSSPFDPRGAEGFRCPLYPLDRVADVVAGLTALMAECRVTDVRVVPGVHGDRDPATGLPLLFKGDAAPLPVARGSEIA